MTYELKGSAILFYIDRTSIIDISVNDVITVPGFPGLRHVWTDHDSDFVENNPDNDIYLQAERVADQKFKATGILLK